MTTAQDQTPTTSAAGGCPVAHHGYEPFQQDDPFPAYRLPSPGGEPKARVLGVDEHLARVVAGVLGAQRFGLGLQRRRAGPAEACRHYLDLTRHLRRRYRLPLRRGGSTMPWRAPGNSSVVPAIYLGLRSFLLTCSPSTPQTDPPGFACSGLGKARMASKSRFAMLLSQLSGSRRWPSAMKSWCLRSVHAIAELPPEVAAAH